MLAIPFDITTLPCPSFCGRDDVLEIMKTFFYGDPSESPTRRTFALCGLGEYGPFTAFLDVILIEHRWPGQDVSSSALRFTDKVPVQDWGGLDERSLGGFP